MNLCPLHGKCQFQMHKCTISSYNFSSRVKNMWRSKFYMILCTVTNVETVIHMWKKIQSHVSNNHSCENSNPHVKKQICCVVCLVYACEDFIHMWGKKLIALESMSLNGKCQFQIWKFLFTCQNKHVKRQICGIRCAMFRFHMCKKKVNCENVQFNIIFLYVKILACV